MLGAPRLLVLGTASAVLMLLNCALVGAQLGTDAPGEPCECSPSCESVSCQGRMVAREDCPCCKVCAQQEGGSCSHPTEPCDTEYGLVCSPEGVCKAEYSCPSDSDSDCPEDRFCLGKVCVDPCPILAPCKGNLKGGECVTKGHRPTCQCPEGHVMNSAGDVCLPNNGTAEGCQHEGRLYSKDEVRYNVGCQEQCRCGADGKFDCGPVKCPSGLFLAGQHSNQELCIELRNRPETDECCVVVACANSLTHPSSLSSPSDLALAPITQEEANQNTLQVLSGRNVPLDPVEPISEEEYQRRLKDLENELNKDHKKPSSTTGDISTQVAGTQEKDEQSVDTVQPTDTAHAVHELKDEEKHATTSDTIQELEVSENFTESVSSVDTVESQKNKTAAANVTQELEMQEKHSESPDTINEPVSQQNTTEPADSAQKMETQEKPSEMADILLELDNEQKTTETPISGGQEDAPVTEETLVEETANNGAEESTQPSATELPEDMQSQDKQVTANHSMPAVIVEYNEEGKEVQRISVQEHVDVVTEQMEEPMVTEAAPLEETTTVPMQEEDETSTEPVATEGESIREGKMAPDDNTSGNESAFAIQEKTDTLSKISAGGLKVLAVTHNSSTLVLPSTKGGDIYYKPPDSKDWQRVSVEAGQDSLVLKGLSPKTQYTLKWSGTSGGSAKMTIDTQVGCQVGNASYGVAQEWSEGCQNKCSCRPDGNPDCQPRCLFVAGNIKDPSCTERPSPEDPDCCVVYDCKKSEDSNVPIILNEDRKPGQPKLLVTEETHNSVTLAWDDFRAKNDEGGYVVEFREEAEVNAAGPETPWMRKELPAGQQLPKITVDNLKPSTIYEVRVSIYDETDDSRVGETTETLTVRTKPGCMYKNESYIVGEFFIGCEERCLCLVNGDTKCFDRCTLPYARAGSYKDDPMCKEMPQEGDECCVSVQCASGGLQTADGHNATTITSISNDSCTQGSCGINAFCFSPPTFMNLDDKDSLNPTNGRCQCREGFVTNPEDTNSCIPDMQKETKEGFCTFKSNTYKPGDVFYDECEYRCSCNNNTEIECEPRCEFPHKDGSKTEPGCEYKPDPEDICCTIRVCNSTSEATEDVVRSPSLISDGCTEGNVTYAKNETFNKGCQTQCICMGFGDVSCFPRCPPLKVVSETPKRCETLPDPEDPCCSITVCDAETPDVMKANITEMEKEMMMMKERMKNMTEIEKKMLMKRMSELEREMMMKNISEMEMILRNMIEEKNMLLINSNISDAEKDMLKKNMTEIEMMMKEVVEMESEISFSNLTDSEKESLKTRLIAIQERLGADEVEENEHDRLHRLGITHSHDMENLTHSHGDETTHIHDHGHLPHTHDKDDIKNHTHIHEDGTTHTHSLGHIPHTHNEMENNTHTHEDGTTHSHPDGHLSHTHDDMENHTHTNEDGTTHTHAGGDISHTHDENEMKNATHTHVDGTTHSHMEGEVSHNHDEMENHTHAHKDGINHSHSGGNMPHTHDEMENHTHTHEDGITHSHPGGDISHTHENMTTVEGLQSHAHTHDITEEHGHEHTHEDGTMHSHTHDHIDESHDHTHAEDDSHDHVHTHEDGTTHSHSHDHMDGSHDHTHPEEDHSHTHTHEDGTTHSHPHDHMNESHDHGHDMNDHIHTHEDGTTHSHPHVDDHTHEMPKNETHHTHEDGTMHSHTHDHIDESHDHTHAEDDSHDHVHTHEDGTTHSHSHDHMDGSHDHTHPEEDHSHTHTHEDGTTHSHPHDHMNESHDHGHDMNDHIHTHEDGTTHSHPHVDDHTHEMPKNETHHMHEDGSVHLHHNDDHMDDHTKNETHHEHEDGSIHMHHNIDQARSRMGEHMHEISSNDTHHMHDDGSVHMDHSPEHSHPGMGAHTHDMFSNDTHHMHEDGSVHMHHNMDENINKTSMGTLEKKNRAEDFGTFNLNILDIMPVNATSVKMRVGVSEDVMSKLLSTEEEYLKVMYSPDSLEWMEKDIPVKDVTVENMEEVVFYINDLEPSTPYQFRIAYREHMSSTSKAQLLDSTMDTGLVFEEPSLNCIPGTQFIEDKECGRLCKCHTDGIAKCAPRCPTTDPINHHKNCSIVPNPHDPCCSVQDCPLDIYAQLGNGSNVGMDDNLAVSEVSERYMTKNIPVETIAIDHKKVKVEDKETEVRQTSDATTLESKDVGQGSASHSEDHAHLNSLDFESKGPISDKEVVPLQTQNKSEVLLRSNVSTSSSEGETSSFTAINHGMHTSVLIKSEEDHVDYTLHGDSEDSNRVNITKIPTSDILRNVHLHNGSSVVLGDDFLILPHALDVTSATNISLPANLPGKDKNEVEVVTSTKNIQLQMEHSPVMPSNIATEQPTATPYLPTGHPHTGSTYLPNEQGPYLPNEHQGSIRDPSDRENLLHLDHSNQNGYLPSDSNSKFKPKEPSYLPKNNEEASYLPSHNGEPSHVSAHEENPSYLPSRNEEPSYLPTHDEEILFSSHNEEPPYLPDSIRNVPYLPSGGVKASHLPSEGEEPHFHLGGEERPYIAEGEEKPSYLPTASGEPPVSDEGHLFPSHIPPPSHNEADISGHTKDNVGTGISVNHSEMCSQNGRYYKPGQEFYEGCSQFCQCLSTLEVHCAVIECPSSFGTELVDNDCVHWEPEDDFIPTPPKCCAPMKCIQSAACEYQGQVFGNYDTIPRELTGCSQICHCEYGNVTCIDQCVPISPVPPADLNCALEDAVRITLPGETCCETWQCAAHSVSGTRVVFPLPPDSVLSGTPTSGFIPINPAVGGDELIPRPHVTQLDPYATQLMFSTPSHFEGLPGQLLIRYTNDPASMPDPETWMQEVIVPVGTTIGHSKWEYIFPNLNPGAQYTMQVMLTVMGTDPITSPVFTFNTLPEAPTTAAPLARWDIDAELYASAITKNSAIVTWKTFSEHDLQYIDGVQVKYMAENKMIPKVSQFFHINNNQMNLIGLEPGMKYEVDLGFLLHTPNQTTQVSNTKPITFMTLPDDDPFAFDIMITAGKVSSQTVEMFYSGIPEPEEKFVNVYRAVYLREEERINAQKFKIPKTGQEKKIFLSDLKPDVKYQVWLEAFLSNGRKKKSNVIPITTRAGQLPKPERSEVDPAIAESKEGDDYYPALVAVAIIAAIACVGFLGLLVILLRKQNHAKAHINSTRNNAAYDNPSYKVGDNGYDMEMNGIKGSSNGATHAEEP